MDFRDYVAAGSLAVALSGFIYNWAKGKGWERKATYRDELANFASDEHTTAIFSEEAQLTARRAAAFLSLQLAERARYQVARRARRAKGWGNVIVVMIASTLAAISFVLLAFYPRESLGSPFIDVVTTVYLLGAAVTVVVIAVRYWMETWKLHKATPNLQALYENVAFAKALDTLDALSEKAESAIDAANAARSEQIFPTPVDPPKPE